MKRTLLASASVLCVLYLGVAFAFDPNQPKPPGVGVTPLLPSSTPPGIRDLTKDFPAPRGSVDTDDSRPLGERLRKSPPRIQGSRGGATPDTTKDPNQVQQPSPTINVGPVPTTILRPGPQPAALPLPGGDPSPVPGGSQGPGGFGGASVGGTTLPGGPMSAPTIAVQPRNVPVPQSSESSDDTDAKKKSVGAGASPAASEVSTGTKTASPGSKDGPALAGGGGPSIPPEIEEMIKLFGGNLQALDELRALLEAVETGKIGAGAAIGERLGGGGPPESGQPDIPQIQHEPATRGDRGRYIGGAPVPFTDKSGQASSDGHQSGPYGDNREPGWHQDRSRGGSHTGRAGTTFREYWSNDRGDTYERRTTIDRREGEEDSTTEITRRADGSGEATRTDNNNNSITHMDVYADGIFVVRVNGDITEKGKTAPTGDNPKDQYPNESASRGGIFCLNARDCQDQMEKAAKALEERRMRGSSPGGMPTETAGTTRTDTSPGTGPGAATDPNPDDIGRGSGGGGQSRPPIYCVGEGCEMPSGPGGGTPPGPTLR